MNHINSYACAPTAAGSFVASSNRIDVKKALQGILGVRDLNNTKNVSAALTQVFVPEEVAGVTRYLYSPRTYSVKTDTTVTLTGARASQFSFAKDMIDEAQKLLKVIYPFSDIDEDLADALKANIETTLDQLLSEFGRLEGPIVSRVDNLFDQLLSPAEVKDLKAPSSRRPVNPGTIQGSIGQLRDCFELSRQRVGKRCEAPLVNNNQQEQNVTNYQIMADYLINLARNWIARDDRDSFGDRLVQLEIQLAAGNDAVEDVRLSLESVGISAAEQRAIKLPSLDNSSLDSLLSWTEDFILETGPKLFNEGGRLAIEREFHSTARQLAKLVNKVICEDLSFEKLDDFCDDDYSCSDDSSSVPQLRKRERKYVKQAFIHLWQILCALQNISAPKGSDHDDRPDWGSGDGRATKQIPFKGELGVINIPPTWAKSRPYEEAREVEELREENKELRGENAVFSDLLRVYQERPPYIGSDDLQLLPEIGEKSVAALNKFGISNFYHIVSLEPFTLHHILKPVIRSASNQSTIEAIQRVAKKEMVEREKQAKSKAKENE